MSKDDYDDKGNSTVPGSDDHDPDSQTDFEPEGGEPEDDYVQPEPEYVAPYEPSFPDDGPYYDPEPDY